MRIQIDALHNSIVFVFRSHHFAIQQDKENEQLAGRQNRQHLENMFFSTSTPRRRRTRHSSLPKFETTASFGLMNSSLSTIETKCLADTKGVGHVARNMVLQTKRLSRKFLGSAGKKVPNTDSTPEYEAVHRDATKLLSVRKSFTKKRLAILKMTANRAQKEKRFAVYNQRRRISESERTVDETYSIGSVANLSAATYNIEANDDDDAKNFSCESDIRGFQTEMNQCQGPIEIIVDNIADDVDFEKLCNVKQSECPFEDRAKLGQTMTLPSLNGDEKSASNLNTEQICVNFSPQSVNSNASGTRMSSHCGRTYWNQQKIPTIERFKAEKKSFDNDSQHSSRSNQSTQSLVTTIKSLQSNVTVSWHSIPRFYQYYMIAITVAFFSIVCYQILCS